jgi:DNA repair exonuclease SbcCD ATPase subunit
MSNNTALGAVTSWSIFLSQFRTDKQNGICSAFDDKKIPIPKNLQNEHSKGYRINMARLLWHNMTKCEKEQYITQAKEKNQRENRMYSSTMKKMLRLEKLEERKRKRGEEEEIEERPAKATKTGSKLVLLDSDSDSSEENDYITISSLSPNNTNIKEALQRIQSFIDKAKKRSESLITMEQKKAQLDELKKQHKDLSNRKIILSKEETEKRREINKFRTVQAVLSEQNMEGADRIMEMIEEATEELVDISSTFAELESKNKSLEYERDQLENELEDVNQVDKYVDAIEQIDAIVAGLQQ